MFSKISSSGTPPKKKKKINIGQTLLKIVAFSWTSPAIQKMRNPQSQSPKNWGPLLRFYFSLKMHLHDTHQTQMAYFPSVSKGETKKKGRHTQLCESWPNQSCTLVHPDVNKLWFEQVTESSSAPSQHRHCNPANRSRTISMSIIVLWSRYQIKCISLWR